MVIEFVGADISLDIKFVKEIIFQTDLEGSCQLKLVLTDDSRHCMYTFYSYDGYTAWSYLKTIIDGKNEGCSVIELHPSDFLHEPCKSRLKSHLDKLQEACQ